MQPNKFFSLREHIQLFYNALHDRGYPSIGCAPCTRATMPGEDLRAGRWWWEQPEHKECGLHRRPAVINVRAAPVASTAASAPDARVGAP